MPQNYSGRVTVIALVLLASLLAIFVPSVVAPREVLFNRSVPLFEKTSIRPGIDIVGGTSLLYEIKQPEGTRIPNLAEEVMTALKRRVDPTGTRNLIWRPQGENRLEIQMPLTAATGAGAERQKQLVAAREQLEATNVSVTEVADALEGRGGRARADFDRIVAAAPQARKQLLADLAAAYDAVRKAAEAQDVEAGAQARQRYEQVQRDLARTNLPPSEVDRVLSLKGSKDKELAKLKEAWAGYPERLAAINAYVAAAAAVGPGGELESAADLKRLLRGSGVLEFHIMAAPGGGTGAEISVDEYQQLRQRLVTEGPRVKAGDKFKWFEVDRPEEMRKQFDLVEHNDRSYALGSIQPEHSLDQTGAKWALTNAYRSQDNTGQNVVGFEFDTVGAKRFGDLTATNVNKPMAIMLDGRIISAPNINSPITGGSGIITGGGEGGFTPSELSYLIRMLGAGSLPAQLAEEPIRERTVGPQLGEDNLRSGLFACALGLVVVGVFLIGYYYLSGLVAYVAVLLNIVIILGMMAAIGATFTLPGIAAIVLTVGTAVDANVLIFERLREEQLRGLPIRMAVRNAYDRAFSAIIDSNMTTLITSLFLIMFGTEEVRGFGITLVIGILASLFTALFVTKTLFGLLIDYRGIKRLGSLPMTYPRWDEMLRPNINWMRLAWPFIAFSTIVIVIGTVLFARYLNRGQMFDIEFASGTAVTFELTEPVKQETIRDVLEAASARNPAVLPSPSVVRVGQEGTVWEVTTPNADSRSVRDLLIATLGKGQGGMGKLKAEQPSTFGGVGQPLDAVLESAVIPLTAETLADASKWPTGTVPPAARNYSGGAAIVLRNLDPRLSAENVSDRITRQVLQAQAGAGAAQDFTVWTGAKSTDPSPVAVVLTGNPDIPVEKDRAKWTENVVRPMWQLVNEGVARPAELRQVTSFDASVAADTQRDALIALTLSILGIMAYIWIRFGNLKYGTATVVALIHDVAFTIAALGIAHLLAGTWFGDLLQVQPFRINVTIVAGILTVMGFSMLDTIVVFDRVRELRGKYGHLSADVINAAINQTLSRTLLTAGTTVVSLIIMYFIGGPGIHGFTFVLLVGILVGTYSSIAIASPFLLLGREQPATATGGRTRPPVSGGQLTGTAGT